MEETHVVEKIIKEVSLCGDRDRGVTKYGCSFNPRSHGKITNS